MLFLFAGLCSIAEAQTADAPPAGVPQADVPPADVPPAATPHEDIQGTDVQPAQVSPELKTDTPKLDPGSTQPAGATKLQGAVSELDAISATAPKLYPEMPKLDCLSFSARTRKELLEAGVRMEYGNLGISWVPGEYPYICAVTGGGGAERAGIRAGDTLIAVNGVSAYGLSPESVNNLVTGIRGQSTVVSITRGGTPHNVYAQYTGIQDLSAFEQPRASWWLNYWRGQ